MPPSVAWGIGVGLIIAAIDTVSLVLMGATGTSEWPIADADFMANVVLYSLIGFRVGQATGVIRQAAEAGVLAGVLVGVIGVAVVLVLRPLDPDARLGEKIRAVEVIPVHVRDDDVRDLLRTDA